MINMLKFMFFFLVSGQLAAKENIVNVTTIEGESVRISEGELLRGLRNIANTKQLSYSSSKVILGSVVIKDPMFVTEEGRYYFLTCLDGVCEENGVNLYNVCKTFGYSQFIRAERFENRGASSVLVNHLGQFQGYIANSSAVRVLYCAP